MENVDFTFSKGNMILIPTFGIHRDERIYEKPEKFVPERFSPEEIQKRPPFSFLPFGDGNHHIKNKLTIREMLCCIFIWIYMSIFRPKKLHRIAFRNFTIENWIGLSFEQLWIFRLQSDWCTD